MRRWSELWIYDCESRTASPLIAVETCVEQAHSYGSPPVFTPDGRFLAVHLSASRGQWEHSYYTFVVDFATDRIKVIHAGWLHLAWLPQPVGRFR